ncbi:MAG: hypothetical protein ACRC67_18150 [Inquilinus sp.]|uniref:hypothetical protein n=1 Tax=Inquilinus sp. TaxID=1932117 RepID=UPI003F3C1F64
MIPESYRSALWYAVLPVDDMTRQLGFAFRSGDTVIRLCLPVENAAQFMAIAAEYIADHLARTNTHSDNSSGSPQVDVSSPLDGEKVCPPTRSSSAAAGE